MINIALLGIALAAVALLVLRRRRSGVTHAADSGEAPADPATMGDEPGAAIGDDVFSKHIWAEAVATLTPVREDEAGQLDAAEDEHDRDAGHIQGLALEPMSDPDDGLGGIITDPGWYLPGEADMTGGGPGAQGGSLLPEPDLMIPGGEPDAPGQPFGATPAPLVNMGVALGGQEPAAGESWLETFPKEWEENKRETIATPAPETLEIVAPPADDPEPELGADDPGPEPEVPPAAQETTQRSSGSNRRRTMVAGAGILGVLLAAIVGWTALKGDSGSGVPAPAAAPAAAIAPATVAPAARTQALASLRAADRAAAQDHPAEARRILAAIDPAVLAAAPDLTARAQILQHRVRVTEAYLAATALAEAGRYGPARQKMLTIVPFRDAGLRARLYGVQMAKALVAQALAQAAANPRQALALLDRAEAIAPSLSAVREARAEAAVR